MGKEGYFLPRAPSNVIQLAVLENAEPPSPKVLAACRSVADENLTRYPQMDLAFVNAVRQYCDASSECEVLPTHGSDSALKLICDTFIDTDTAVLLPVPTYPHFQHFLSCSKTLVKFHPCAITMETAHEAFDIIRTALGERHYDMCYLVNPSMPLGYKLSIAQIAQLATEYPKCLFITDEAYAEYGNVPLDERMGATDTAIKLCEKDNVIVVRTFSKAFGLAALRIGYIVCNRANYRKLRILYNEKDVTRISMTAAKAALDDLPHYRRQIAWTLTVKDDFVRGVRAVAAPDSPVFDVYAGHGNFVFLLCHDPVAVTEHLFKHGVLVRNKDPEIPKGVRLGIGSKTNMELVRSLVAQLNGHSEKDPRSYVFDLDGVLRTGSRDEDPLDTTMLTALRSLGQKPSYRTRLYLVTNNCGLSAKDLRNQFLAAGVHFTRVITPVEVFLAARKPCPLYVIGMASCKETLAASGFRILSDAEFREAEALLILNEFYGLTADTWMRVMYLAQKVPWFVSEASRTAQPRHCAEAKDASLRDMPEMTGIEIPDIGLFSGLISHVAHTHPIVLGKPFVPVELLAGMERPLHFVGDSESDCSQAEAWGASYSDITLFRR